MRATIFSNLIKTPYMATTFFNRPHLLGNKIVVVGVSASGKSTFARKLAQKTNLPLTHMDAIMWTAGWNYIGDAETIKKLEEVSARAEWIIEGYISSQARTFLFEQADTIIFLDYSGWLSACRYIQRWWRHRKTARQELEGSPEQFSWKFLKLVFTKGENLSLERFLLNIHDQSKIIRLSSQKKTDSFLSMLK